MGLNNLDKGKLNELQNFQMDFDQDSMWKEIEERKKKRSIFTMILWGIGVSLMLFTFTYFISPSNSTIKKENASNINDYVEARKYEDSYTETDSNFSKKEVENSLSNSVDDINNIQKTIIANISKGFHPSSKEKQKQIESQINKIATNPSTKLSHIKSPQPVVYGENLNIKSNIKSVKDKIFTTNQYSQISKIHSRESFVKLDFDRKHPILKTNLKTFHTKSKIFVSPSIGIGYSFQSFTPKNEKTPVNRNNFRQLETWSAGIQLDFKIKNQIIVGSGIEFLQHNEQLNTYTSETNNIASFNPDEIPSEYIGLDGFLTIRATNKFQNNYRLLNVPLSFSWLLRYKKLNLAPSASIIFNINQKAKGKTQDKSGLILNSTPFYNTTTGIAYRLGSKFSFTFNSKNSIFVNPQIEFGPNDITTNLNSFAQQRNLVLLNIGFSRAIK